MKGFITGILVFSFFFFIGILLARHKPLWTDELCLQQSTIQDASWPDIISGHTIENNKFPLYFALQKGFLQVLHYQLPFVWKGENLVVDPYGQVVLRVLPDLLMSLAMSAIVLFFGFRSGFVSGVVAALFCLSMPMVWMFWVEAKQYALWFALTAFQSLLFLDTASKKGGNAPVLPFALVHAGLCLSAPFGVIQTIVGQGLLWCAGRRDIKFHFIAGLLPVFLGAYYFMAQEKISIQLYISCQEIFLRNFQLEELVFLGMYTLLLLLLKGPRPSASLGRAFLPFCLTFIAIAVAGLFYVVWKSTPHSTLVVERHFIFLTPIGVIMTAAIFSDLWLAVAGRSWLRLGLLLVFAAGVLGQILTTYEIVHFTVYY